MKAIGYVTAFLVGICFQAWALVDYKLSAAESIAKNMYLRPGLALFLGWPLRFLI